MNITPFIQICPLDEGLAAAARFNLRPTELRGYTLPNGFIAVRFSWHSKGGMKYVKHNGNLIGFGNKISFCLEFPDVRFLFEDEIDDFSKMNFEIVVGLNSDKALDYTPLFIQNLKYEVMCYFAPKGWAGKSEDWNMFHAESLDIKE